MGITDPSEQYFKDGGWHWTGSVWIKGGLAFEYADQLVGQVTDASASAGANLLESGTVPAGEIWVVTALSTRNNISTVSARLLGIKHAGTYHWLAGDAGGAAYSALSWAAQLIAIEDDLLAATLRGCTLNDDIFFDYAGYIMRLVEIWNFLFGCVGWS